MYITNKATRKQALKAAAAARRAMKRHACCKSQFKFKCFSCGEMINRGDKITRCMRGSSTGMELRYRGGDSQNGLTMVETAFYQAETGSNMWVHIGCVPCYWDKGVDNEWQFTRPSFRPICTNWGNKVCGEWDEWCGSQHIDYDHFCLMKGYPKEKSMRARIFHAVTRFQALWRGYLYKKAYPIARLDAIATRIINEAGHATLSTQTVLRLQNREARARARYALYQEMRRYTPDIGEHVEILFNAKEPSEYIYSGEVIEVQSRGSWVKIKVKFHYDGEVRKYTGKKFKLLKKECEEHKKKLGIEAKLTGRLNTARIGRIVFPNSPSIQDWRYHYPDATPVR